MNYEGPIVCKNCGSESHTDDPQCDCTRFNPDFAEPDFQPFDREPYDYIATLKARIAELEKNQIPEGCVAVPDLPTYEMRLDGIAELSRSRTRKCNEHLTMANIYRAMILARGK